MNVSLTPNNTLGRLIYSFSCTLNEVDSCTFKNYNLYGIQDIGKEYYDQEKYYLKYGVIEFPDYSLQKEADEDYPTWKILLKDKENLASKENRKYTKDLISSVLLRQGTK